MQKITPFSCFVNTFVYTFVKQNKQIHKAMKATVNTNQYYASTLSTPCGYGMWSFRFITSNGHVEEFYSKPAYYTEAVKWAKKRANELQSCSIIVLP